MKMNTLFSSFTSSINTNANTNNSTGIHGKKVSLRERILQTVNYSS